MAVVDLFRERTDSALLARRYDVCIVGTGPAGSTIARELSGLGLQAIVLESGSFERRDEVDALSRIENVGRPRAEQWSVRNRIVGGSSHTWGGRSAAFDDVDFEKRSWVPFSGWPITLPQLKPYLDRSVPYLGLARGTNFTGEDFWAYARRKPPGTTPDPTKLLPFFWQFSRDDKETYPYEYMRFGRHLVERIGSNITLVVGATALGITTVESGGAVEAVEVARPDGGRHVVRAATVILCAGGIENARLLLSSDQHSPQGLGNDRDVVGRYLMDHLRGSVGSLDVAGTRSLQKQFGRYNIGRHLFRAGLRLSPEVQRREQLLNCAAWLGETVAADDPWDALRRLIGGKASVAALLSIASNVPLLCQGAVDYFIERNGLPRKLSQLVIDCMVEQRPDPESRLTLSADRDRFGMRLPRIDWRSHPEEARTMHRMADLMIDQFTQMGAPAPQIAEWVRDKADIPASFVDVAHPAGTTRMSDDPATGVVDATCQVHGVQGLFIAGSSVFPTGGHCNPTQMIVAMALRVADAARLRITALQSSLVTVRSDPTAAPKTVLLTGATGRIGRVLLQDLLSRQYRVRATTSRSTIAPNGLDGLEWRRFDFLADRDYDALVAGCDAVIHLAAEIGKIDRMQELNVAATDRLSVAAEGAGIKAFCYTSSVAVYGSGRQRDISETSPVLTVDHDARSEYWALDYVRMYGRTKLAGEYVLRNNAKRSRYVILRPSVVVDVQDLAGIRNWSLFKRTLAAHRHAHHIYVRDVSDAIIWAMERALGDSVDPGHVDLFNLCDDDCVDAHHAAFMKRAFDATHDGRFRIVRMPWIFDWLHDFLRFRSLPLRNPLWRMRFSSERLSAVGYRLKYGMAEAHARALASLRAERDGMQSSGKVS